MKMYKECLVKPVYMGSQQCKERTAGQQTFITKNGVRPLLMYVYRLKMIFVLKIEKYSIRQTYPINTALQLARWESLVEQELPTLPEHLSSISVFSDARVSRSLVFLIVFL